MSPATVKHTLTANPPEQTRPTRHTRRRRDLVDNHDYAAFAHRILAAHGRRIAHGDIEGLTHLAELSTQLDTALHTAITGLRHTGYSWTDIGTRLGITRQAAQQRWGAGP